LPFFIDFRAFLYGFTLIFSFIQVSFSAVLFISAFFKAAFFISTFGPLFFGCSTAFIALTDPFSIVIILVFSITLSFYSNPNIVSFAIIFFVFVFLIINFYFFIIKFSSIFFISLLLIIT